MVDLIDPATVVAARLDEIDLSGWRDRLMDARRTVARGAADADDGTVRWTRTGSRVDIGTGGVHLLIAIRPSPFRAGCRVLSLPRPEDAPVDASDRDAVLGLVDRVIDAVGRAIPDEGSDDAPGPTWDVLLDGLVQLGTDAMNMVADRWNARDPGMLDLLRREPARIVTGAPWGLPSLTIPIDGVETHLVADAGRRMLATMINPLVLVSSPLPRTLAIGPADVALPRWRDPGAVETMRSIARFTTSRPT